MIGSMQYFLYIISIFWILCAVLFIFFPKKGKKIFSVMLHALPPWLWAIIVLGAAVLFWLSASVVATPLLVKILAVFAAVKGLLCLVLPKSFVTKVWDWFFNWPNSWCIASGVLMLVLAICLLSQIPHQIHIGI